MRTTSGRLIIGIVMAGAMVGAVAAQGRQDQTPPLVISSMVGRDLFQFYCATCHGADAKGSGPAAGALKTPPADLTIIAKRNGGLFPRAQLTAFVANGDPLVAAHGSRAMPVWGPIFRALDPSDTRATIRIDNLVAYLESLQQK